jgi:hypothetical protein
VRLEPRAARVRVTADAPGTVVNLDGVVGPDVERTVTAGSRVTAAVEPLQRVGDVVWEFGGWSDGELATTRELRPSGDVTLGARFAPVPRGDPGTGRDAAPPDARRKPLRITVARPRARRLARVVPLIARCTAACRLSARAALEAAGRRHALPVPRSRARRSGRRFAFRLPEQLRTSARRVLRQGRTARLQVTLRARGADGVSRTKRVRIPLELA